jgi:hypothetical protein
MKKGRALVLLVVCRRKRMTVGRGRAERNQGRDGGTYTSGGGGRVLARLLDCLVKLDDFFIFTRGYKIQI